MKKNILITILLIGTGFLFTAGAQVGMDYIYLGDNRASIPGMGLMSSVYTLNPAETADAVHNSISYSQLFSANIIVPERQYSFSIPNFSLVNISQGAYLPGVGGDLTFTVKNLIGLQLGVGLQDFVRMEDIKAAVGIGVYRLQDRPLDTAVRSTQESFNTDLGVTASLFNFNLELLLKNVFLVSGAESELFGPSFDITFRFGSKIIMDVDYILGFSTAKAYTLPGDNGNVDFLAEMNFTRYFFSNSLRTGVGFVTFLNIDSDIMIPIIKYNISISYIPVPFGSGLVSYNVDKDTFGGKTLWLFKTLLSNIAFSFDTSMMVNSIPGYENLSPVVSLGLVKYY